jgi:choice-of-anchor A domain-containing protein
MRDGSLRHLFFSLLLLLGLAVIPAHANGYLYAANGYNLFVQNTITFGGPDNTQGAVAAGGNVSAVNGTSFASLAGNGPYAPGTYALVTGGKFQPAGSGTVNGNLWEAFAGTPDLNYGASGTTTIGGIDPIDFVTAFQQLDTLSTTLSGYSNTIATGNGCVNSSGNIICTANATGLNVINIPYSAVTSSAGGTVTSADLGAANLTFNVGSSATGVVINIVGDASGNSVKLGSGKGFTVHGDGTKLLFNYSSANALVIGGSVSASLLAPYSTVTTASGLNGEFDGNFIAGAYSGSGLAFHTKNKGDSDLFTGVLPQPSSPTPEPATWAMFGGGAVLVWIGRRRKRS